MVRIAMYKEFLKNRKQKQDVPVIESLKIRVSAIEDNVSRQSKEIELLEKGFFLLNDELGRLEYFPKNEVIKYEV
jgi:hypothetical protein